MVKFIFYISFYLFINLNAQIIIPLESFQSQMEDESESPAFINELLDTNIASIIKIGSQSYPLKTFFDINSPFFYISNQCNIGESSSFNYETNFNYNRYKSSSFYNTSSFDLCFGKSFHACTATENFEINNYEKKEIKLDKINFILNEDTNQKKNNCLQIGLIQNINKDTSFKGFNLITQLKQKNYVKEYIWTMKFNNVNKYNNNLLYDPDELLNLKGNLIIGDYPHNLDSNNYYKSQFIKTYSSFSENVMKWELKFNKIYYNINNEEQKVDDINVNLDPSNYLIFAPKNDYESIIQNYFQKYLNEDICQYNYIEEYVSIICDKSEKFSINEIKTFPLIYFEHVNLDYTFELSFKELFIEKDNIYYFLIISDSLFYTTGWTLGNIFMRKYQFIFNLDSKEIGFYNPKLNKYENEENHIINKNISNVTLYIILIIILCLLLFGIALFIKMKFYPKNEKKKRANELDDEYEYVTYRNNNHNENKKDNIDHNKLFNNSNIN